MKISIHTHIGKRSNQEDKVTHDKNNFLVCDGVGGHEKGEIASSFVSENLLEKSKKLKDSSDLETAIVQIQHDMNQLLEKEPNLNGMGTTLVGFHQIAGKWYSAHIGDSRLIWARPKTKEIWHTWDHSFVAHLVSIGEISREEARFHPRNNEIQRAIVANSNDKVNKPEITELKGLLSDDIILICSDGITEVWSDFELAETLTSDDLSFDEKARLIFDKAKNEANDNNTGILLQLEKEDVKHSNGKMADAIDLVTLEEDFNQYNDLEDEEDYKRKKRKGFLSSFFK